MGARLLAVAACLLVSSCSSTPTGTGVSYQTYAYNCCVEITSITVWHPGDHLTLHWQSQPYGTTTESAPQAVKLRLTLTGPFSTVNALKTAISEHHLPAGVRSIDAQNPAVTDQSGGTPVSELDLPADLPPGYYNLEPSITVGSATASGGAIITVQ